MFVLIKAGNVLFLFNFANNAGFSNNERCFRLKREYFGSCTDLAKYNIFYFHDGREEPSVVLRFASIMVFNTPRKERYRNFQKGRTHTFYVPWWNEHEIIRLNIGEVDGQLEVAVLKERFEITGGMPRHFWRLELFYSQNENRCSVVVC